MTRRRLIVLALTTGTAVVGVPVPVSAAPAVPPAVERSVAVDRSIAVQPSATRGAFVERGPIRLPVTANLVAVSFASAATGESLEKRLSVEARFHSADGWSGWERLAVEPDEGPDGAEARNASPRRFAGPIWVGTADQMMLRFVSYPGGPDARDLRTHVINTLGNATTPNVFERVTGAISRLLRGGAVSAEAATVQPGIITRAQWGADERIRECCPRYATAVNMAFVHHTAGTNNYTAGESAGLVRGIYTYHVKTRGFADIGYNFLVDRYGQIFEGRSGGMTEPVIGAHVSGFNTGSTGMSLMGDFTGSSPTGAMVDALQRLLAWKLDVHHVPPNGTTTMISGGNEKWAAGTTVTFQRISGHRDGDSTACPGIYAYNMLPSIRANVNAIGNPKIFSPATDRSVLRPDGDTKDETASITASFDDVRNWTVSLRDAAGAPLRSFSGRGASATATWDGKRSDGSYPPSGIVTWQIEASDDAGGTALPASGTLALATTHYDGTPLASGAQTVWLQGGARRAVPSALVRDSWFRSVDRVTATDVEIARYPAGASVGPREGTIIVTPDGQRAIISGGQRRPFESDAVYAALGYTAASAIPASAADAALVPAGSTVTDTSIHPSGAVVRDSSGDTWTIEGGARRKHRTATVRMSWYRDAEVVPATAADLALPVGSDLPYREGTVLRPPDANLWIYAAGVRRWIPTPLYTALGYGAGAAFNISSDEASAIPPTGPAPTGTLPPGTNPNPFGSFDFIAPAPGGALIQGWAIDPNTADPISVHFYADGRFAGAQQASGSRPDVGQAYPAYGPLHAFSAAIPLPAGGHTVCVYGINVGAGTVNSTIGCKAVTVLGGAPFGSFDFISSGPGGVSVTGWAIDPDTVDPIPVHVYADGAFAGDQLAAGWRPDVGAAYPGYGPNHAYTRTLSLGPGTHTVCVYAINAGSGSWNPPLGCKQIGVPANPFGSFDFISQGPAGVSVSGWAIDPNTADPIAVHIYVDGAFAAWEQAAGSRPDVGSAYPGYGPNHGYTSTLVLGAGTHTVCVYAINVGPGTGNPAVGCKQISVAADPFGSFDHISPVSGGAAIAGWAIDPNTAEPIAVHVYVDGAFAAWQQASGSRPDVGNAYPGYGPNHGFGLTVTMGSGTHTVCVYAINVGLGTGNPPVGCKQITL